MPSGRLPSFNWRNVQCNRKATGSVGAGVKNALYVAGFLCLCAIGWLACEAAMTQRAARVSLADIHELKGQAKQLLTDADRTTVIIAGSATNVERSTRQWKDQSIAQAQQATQAAKTLNGDLIQFGTLLETATSTLQTQSNGLNALETTVGTSFTNLNESVQPSLKNLADASAALAQRTPVILDNLSQTSAQGVIIATNVSGATDDIHQTTHDVAAFTHRELAPVKGVWNTFKAILMEFAGPAASVATAIK
jgi:hypothetical protein